MVAVVNKGRFVLVIASGLLPAVDVGREREAEIRAALIYEHIYN
jgi:hypothetical protein